MNLVIVTFEMCLFVCFFFNLGHSIRDNTSSLCSSLRPRHGVKKSLYHQHQIGKSEESGSHSIISLGMLINYE